MFTPLTMLFEPLKCFAHPQVPDRIARACLDERPVGAASSVFRLIQPPKQLPAAIPLRQKIEQKGRPARPAVDIEAYR